ncbi:DUF4019 domain-containing protein [Granulicella sp. S190]|uniref:DUF4019 domain-containing protein n=1 Tax=Granulicella sp. S190 TaxID=1747226 RepID=UPI00131C9898|nr:DUF4019 domain-containing protein [Granulicella sp. S190]
MRRVLRCVLGMGVMVGAVGGLGRLVAQERSPLVQQTAEQIAAREAEGWLAMMDAGKYAESWKAAAEVLRSAVTAQKFASSIEAVRGPMGKLESRKLQSATYTTLLPGVPPGDYVMILYSSSFEQKQVAQETVIMSREKDKVWRVAGYYIK